MSDTEQAIEVRPLSKLQAIPILRRRAEVEIAAEHPRMSVRAVKRQAKINAENAWLRNAKAGRVFVEKRDAV